MILQPLEAVATVVTPPQDGVPGQPRFSNVFQSHMVLQRGQPIDVWGFGGQVGDSLQVTLYAGIEGSVSWAQAIVGDGGEWRTVLEEQPSTLIGKPLSLCLSHQKEGAAPIQNLTDVVLGDVYLYTGQSNVDLPVTYVHQFTPAGQEKEEQLAEQIGRTGLLRIMIVPARCGLTYHDGIVAKELAHVPECNSCPPAFGPQQGTNKCNLLGGRAGNYSYCNCDSLHWARTSPDNIRGFSAVAWFMGRALLEQKAVVDVPIGLVRSSWGATNIAVWSGPDAIAKCPQEGEPPSSFAPYIRSALYAHMVMPLRGLRFSAVVWVHGARNVGPASDPYMGGTYYACALRAMIEEWREKLLQPHLPFLIVESPIYCNELDYRTWHTWCDDKESKLTEPDVHLPEMRLAQNKAEHLPGVYLVSTMDQGNLQKAMGGAIHSVGKRDLGKRLAVAARSAVYNDSKAVWTGPRPKVAFRVGASRVSICFDLGNGGDLKLNRSATCPDVILPVYCTGGGFELGINGSWVRPQKVTVCGQSVILEAFEAFNADRVRYAWADWPVNMLKNDAGMPTRIFNMPIASNMDEALSSCPGGASAIWCKSGDDSDQAEASEDGPKAATSRASVDVPPKADTSSTDGSTSFSLIALLVAFLVTLSLIGFFLVYGRDSASALMIQTKTLAAPLFPGGNFPGGSDLDKVPSKSFLSDGSAANPKRSIDTPTVEEGEAGEGSRLMPLTSMPAESSTRWKEKQNKESKLKSLSRSSSWFSRKSKDNNNKKSPRPGQSKSLGNIDA